MKKVRILLTVLLVMALALPMIAQAEEIMTPYGAYPETVTITTVKPSPFQPNLLAGDTVEDNPMTRYIKEKINVEIVVEWEAEISEYANKLALMMAGGSLPDMFSLSTNDYLIFKQLLENDMLAPLDEVYEACANDYVRDTLATYDGRNFEPFYGEDGKLYALAGGRYAYEHNLLWLRQDWLDAYGLQAPTTLDDIKAILVAWKDTPPSEGYVGMQLHYESVGGVYDAFSASPIFASFGAYPGMWLQDEDGNALWGSVAPQTKEGLRVLAQWYQEGLIDQQFATRSASGAQEALVNGGLSGAMFAPWWIGYSVGDFPLNNPDGDIVPYNAPLDAQGKYNIAFPGASGAFLCVNKDFANPEAVVKMINCEFDMWRGFDPEGAALIEETRTNNVDWEYLFPTNRFNIEPNDVVPEAGLATKALVETGSFGDTNPNPQVALMAEKAANYATLGPADAETADWIEYHTRYLGSNMMYFDYVAPVYPAYAFVTDSMADLKPNLDTLEKTTFLKIVTGELPIDAFDQFVEDWYAQGGQRMTDEVTAIIK